MKYKQCLLSKGQSSTVAWIEERGAKEGYEVELKTADGDFWRVDKVYPYAIDEDALRTKQANDRNALPSIAGRGA